MDVSARAEKSRRRNGPPLMDMSMAPRPSILPSRPRSAWRRACSTRRRRSVNRKMTASSTIITRPPLNSAARNCQPRRMSSTRPSSKTRLVEANSKMTAFPSVDPLRNSVRATATAAYEQDEEAAPKTVAIATDFGVSRPTSARRLAWKRASRRPPTAGNRVRVARGPARTWRTTVGAPSRCVQG